MLKVAQFISLSRKHGHALDAVRLFHEQQNAEKALAHAGFDSRWVNATDNYMMAAVAISGLTWDLGMSEMYPELDEFGRFQVRLTYKGAAKIALNAGLIEYYQTWALHEGDIVTGASDSTFPEVVLQALSADRGPILGSVASAKLKSGEIVHYQMDGQELESCAEMGSEVWRGVFGDEMAKKQALWRLLGHTCSEPINAFFETLERDFAVTLPKARDMTHPKTTKYQPAGIVQGATSVLDQLLGEKA